MEAKPVRGRPSAPARPTCTASSTLITATSGGHSSGMPVRTELASGTDAATSTARPVGTRNASVTSGQYIGRNIGPARPRAWNNVGSARESAPKRPQ